MGIPVCLPARRQVKYRMYFFYLYIHLFTTANVRVPVQGSLRCAGWEAAVDGCLQPACVRQQLVQSGWVTSSTELSGGRKLKERSCEGSLRGNREDATPAVHPSGLSSAAHGGMGTGCSGLGEKSKECRGFLTPTPTCFKAEDDKAAAAGTEQLRIRVPPLALCRAGKRNSRLRVGCGLWRAVAREWGDECRINGELSSVPEGQAIAHDLNPPGVADRNINVHVSDTNIARDSSAGFAADAGEGVLERYSARVGRTPEVAQAARWSPNGSRLRPHRHVRGQSARGRRSRRSSRTRNCALTIATSSEVGRTVNICIFSGMLMCTPAQIDFAVDEAS